MSLEVSMTHIDDKTMREAIYAAAMAKLEQFANQMPNGQYQDEYYADDPSPKHIKSCIAIGYTAYGWVVAIPKGKGVTMKLENSQILARDENGLPITVCATGYCDSYSGLTCADTYIVEYNVKLSRKLPMQQLLAIYRWGL